MLIKHLKLKGILSETIKIPYNPAVLRWARERLGMPKNKAAESLNIPVITLESIENGSIHASLDQLKALAKAYRRTLATLLLHQPPSEKPMPKDFRSVNSSEVDYFSEQTFIAVRKARAYVGSLLELKEDAGINTPKFSLKFSLQDKPEAVATNIRTRLQLDQIRSITDPKLALDAYIEKLEDEGLAIFQLSLTKDNVRGFALIDESIPVIGIKRGGEPIYGKIFTLFHELGHVLLQVSAISDTSQITSNSVEQWCNAFAAAIIFPNEYLKNHPIVKDYEKRRELIWLKKDLIEIGQSFHAGPLATLRALLNIGRTTQEFYREKHLLWNKPQFGRSKTPEGRNPPKETIIEKGKTYVALAFRAYDHNQINLKDLSDYLGLRMKYIPKTRQLLSA